MNLENWFEKHHVWLFGAFCAMSMILFGIMTFVPVPQDIRKMIAFITSLALFIGAIVWLPIALWGIWFGRSQPGTHITDLAGMSAIICILLAYGIGHHMLGLF